MTEAWTGERGLKTGWRMVRFGDVVRQCKEKVDRDNNPFERYVEGGHMDSEDIHIRRWGEFGEDYVGPAFHRIFRKGQVLYGSRRTYLKKVAVADFDGITANTTFVLETKDQNVFMQELLPFLMLTDKFTEHSIQVSKGSTNPYINWPDIAKFEFPLPPIEEQKRIAEILWAADEVEERYSQVWPTVESSRTALLSRLMSDNHEVVQLGKVLSYASDGPFGSKLKTDHYSESGARVIRLQNIDVLRFDNSDKSFIPIDYYKELQRYALYSGDLLVAGLGDDSHPVGRACLVPEWLGPAINKADCFCLRPDIEAVLPEFLCYFLNSLYARKEIMRITQGTTRYRINVSNLKTVRVSIPSESVQKEFVRQMHELDLVEQDLAAHTKKTADLRRVLSTK